jgi:excisionase family DNA binding protein
MSDAEHDEYLSPGQVALVFHVSPKTVSRWAAQRLLPCVVTLGGHRRFRGEDVEEVRRRIESEGQASASRGPGVAARESPELDAGARGSTERGHSPTRLEVSASELETDS